MKVFLSIITGIGIFILLWYFGFLDFIGIKGAECSHNPGTGGAPNFMGNYKYGKCERIENKVITTKTCAEEYQEAEASWANSKQTCILTSEQIICPRDSNYSADVNPCVGKILKEKGWKNPDISLPPSNSTPPTQVTEIEVTNPQGAPLYYQSFSQKSGGHTYSASNVIVPVGTKMEMVGFWQTNLTTQPLGGFYETTYQPYVKQNSFFDLKDVKKV